MLYNIIFMRHGCLAGRYHDYNKLTYSELRNLWLNIGNYSIDKTKKMISEIDFWEIKICITSLQQRTIETAHMMWLSSIIKTESISEIYFDLSELITEEEYKVTWLAGVRVALWKSFFERKPWVESPEALMERILSFVAKIAQLNVQNIAVIWHWFYLQMIKCFLVEWVDFTKISYEDFLHLEIKPISYLESFEVKLHN